MYSHKLARTNWSIKKADTMRTIIGFLLALITPGFLLIFDRRADTQWLLKSILLIGFFISPLAIMVYKSLIDQQVVSFAAYLKRGILIATIPVLFFLFASLFLVGDFTKTLQWVSLAFFYICAYSFMTTTFLWLFFVKKEVIKAFFICLTMSITFWTTVSFFAMK